MATTSSSAVPTPTTTSTTPTTMSTTRSRRLRPPRRARLTTTHDEHDDYHDDGYGHHDAYEHEHHEGVAVLSRSDRRVREQADRGGGRRTGRALRRLLVFLVAIGLIAAAGFAAVSVLRPMVAGFGERRDRLHRTGIGRRAGHGQPG